MQTSQVSRRIIPSNFTELHVAVLDNNLTGVRKTLEKHPEYLYVGNSHELTPFDLAVANQCTTIANYLFKRGANFKFDPEKGITPLHRAAGAGMLDIAKEIIQQGGSVYAEDANGDLPIHKAIRANQLEMARYLSEMLGNDTRLSQKQIQRLHSAFGQESSEEMMALAKQLKQRFPIIDNHQFSPSRPLYLNQLGYEDNMLKSAYERGGTTALLKTVVKLYPKDPIPRKFIRWCVASRADMHKADDQGVTLLHLLAQLGFVREMLHCIRLGADIYAKDVNGFTPLVYGISTRGLHLKQIAHLYYRLHKKEITEKQNRQARGPGGETQNDQTKIRQHVIDCLEFFSIRRSEIEILKLRRAGLRSYRSDYSWFFRSHDFQAERGPSYPELNWRHSHRVDFEMRSMIFSYVFKDLEIFSHNIVRKTWVREWELLKTRDQPKKRAHGQAFER